MRSRRLLIALGGLTFFVFMASLLVGFSLSAPTPTIPTSAGILCRAEVAAPVGPVDVGGRECFWSAYLQRRPAEFRTTRSTIEGDPITFIYRIRADGSVEVVIDSRQDRFSNRGISFLDCRELVRLDDPALPDPIEFGPTDSCVERSRS